MGTGWRRAFCTTIPRDRELKFVDKHLLQDHEPSLRCKTTSASSNDDNNDDVFTPNLHCRTTTPKSNSSNSKTPRFSQPSNPASPRSPFSILKSTLRLSKHSCGICMHSVKTGQGMAIYTAECSHSFHFPCIVSHSRKQSTLFCPVCNRVWKDVPLLSGHLLSQREETGFEREQEQDEQKKFIRKKTEPENLPNIKQQGTSLKTYDDDEPLHFPAAGFGKSTANSEANGKEDDEVEEFQGFFVNPVSSDEVLANHRETRDVEFTILPEAAIVSLGGTHVTYAVVLKVKAPPPQLPAGYGSSGSGQLSDTARRAPIDLVTLLDVSGSMNGPKLEMSKRAMGLVISSLGSADRLSIVAFAATAKRLLPLRRMTAQGQTSARKIVDQLVCSQGTCVGDALRKAAKVLEDRREKNPVASIMLLSDGQGDQVPKYGEPDGRRETVKPSSTRFSHIEIPVGSSGLGKKAGHSHSPNVDAFSKCLGGLLSVVAQDLRIQLGFTSSREQAEVVAVYSYHGRPAVQNRSSVRLGDLYADEERELLVEVRVPSAAVGAHHVLSLKCCHIDPATQDMVNAREQCLLLPRPQAVGSLEIQRLRNSFVTTRGMRVQNGSCYECVRGLDGGELTGVHVGKHNLLWKKTGIQWRRVAELADEDGEPLTPTSAWRAAEKLAKVAMKKKPASTVSDLHGFENARF
ncbi:unnamed protein product [Cuscuta campestris]|uniref:RING-type domain-containing protein n=1 Tax=Cuscuta campestris TaxID=132261 RepID=A0A484LFI3_9ASTE|nr:unnamed protein product [Cuscuta campestris]